MKDQLNTNVKPMAYWIRWALGSGAYLDEIFWRNMKAVRAAISEVTKATAAVDEAIKPKKARKNAH